MLKMNKQAIVDSLTQTWGSDQTLAWCKVAPAPRDAFTSLGSRTACCMSGPYTLAVPGTQELGTVLGQTQQTLS